MPHVQILCLLCTRIFVRLMCTRELGALDAHVHSVRLVCTRTLYACLVRVHYARLMYADTLRA